AEPLFQEVVKSRTVLFRVDHPEMLKAKHKQALMHTRERNYEQAERLLREVLAISSDKLGPSHLQTVLVTGDLAAVYLYQEKFDQAEPLLLQVVRQGHTSLRWFGHPEVRRGEKNLVFLYRRLKQFEKAEAFFKEQLAWCTEKWGPENLKTLKPKQELAMLHHRQGRSDLAEAILRECLQISVQKEPDSWKTANTRSLLGESLLGQKKHAQAEPLLLEAYRVLKRHAGKP